MYSIRLSITLLSLTLLGTILAGGCAEQTASPADAAITTDTRVDGVTTPETTVDVGIAGDLAPDASPSLWDELNKLSGASFAGIWGSEPKDLFIVGEGGQVFHRDGYQWIQEETGVTTDLYGVYGISSDEVYAVGDRVLLTYNGTSWTDSTDYSNNYRAVWGTADGKVWAVGLAGAMRSRPAGSGSWTAIPGSGTDKDLYGIWGNESVVYAVGQEGTMIKLDGAKWVTQSSGVTADLRGIWGNAANDIYAAGDGGLLIHFDGSSWSLVETPSTTNFTGIWGHGDQLFLVGNWTAEHPQVQHFDGTNWTGSSPAGVATVRGIWGFTPEEVFVINTEKIFQYQP